MNEFFMEVSRNYVLMSALISWGAAQGIKMLIACYTHQELKWERLIGAGGMPSSHVALAMGLTVASLIREGASSTLFAIAFVVTVIVMYDAAGVRRAAGKQAKVINRLVVEMRVEHKVREIRLKELLGHSPMEVVAGAILGMITAVVLHSYTACFR